MTSEISSMKIRRATVVTIQTPQDGICWNHDPRRCHPASGFAPALDSRGVVAPYVSLYLGLPRSELPFRENLSEGSVLFVEYSFCSILGCLISSAWRRSAGA